jgi:hypothetical protein
MKKALLIGINYPGTDSELQGCANDCLASMDILKKYFGYLDENIIFLTDSRGFGQKQFEKYEKPTGENIRKYIKWLVNNAKSGDHLFFHYSGHGSYTKDENGDELTGCDEVICPCDYETKGYIVDDELFSTLIEPLPSGTKLFSIMDCCHSGTLFDLKYSYNPVLHCEKKLFITGNKECQGNIIMISGCRDTETSDDAFINKKYTGAFTYAFSTCLSNWYNIHKSHPTLTKLLSLITKYMEDNKYTQRPQINCSNDFDIKQPLDI